MEKAPAREGQQWLETKQAADCETIFTTAAVT